MQVTKIYCDNCKREIDIEKGTRELGNYEGILFDLCIECKTKFDKIQRSYQNKIEIASYERQEKFSNELNGLYKTIYEED